jgi:hypothetical protein
MAIGWQLDGNLQSHLIPLTIIAPINLPGK